jgi:drug/metabolite transporter (DMT)-like permease
MGNVGFGRQWGHSSRLALIRQIKCQRDGLIPWRAKHYCVPHFEKVARLADTVPQSSDNNPVRGIVLTIVTMLIFAAHDAVIKVLTVEYAAPQILWIRFIFFSAFALALARRKGPLRKSTKSARPLLQIGRSLILLLDMVLFVVAVGLLPLADTHALIATFPLMVTALSALILREHVGLRRWLAVGACFLGVLLILRPGMTVLQPGSLIALAAAFSFALYNIMTRIVSRHDSGEVSLVYVGVIGLVATSFAAPFFWVWPTTVAWLMLAAIGIIGALAHFLLITALKAAPASVLQPFNYTLLLAATAIGYFVFGQFPDFWTVIGASVIVASGLYVIQREYSIRRQEHAAADVNTPAN